MRARNLSRFPVVRWLRSSSAAALVLLLLACASWAQQPTNAPPQPATPAQSQSPSTPSQPSASGTAQAPAQTEQPSTASKAQDEQPQPETHISKAQAKELFRSVDEILQFASHDTDLPIEHKVKRNLITRAQVEHYVNKRMKDDKDTKRLEEAKLVLEQFGLLPRGYDLHAEFLRLMAEQVAAYYDPRSQSVNLLDWLPPDAQKPVLAHELTHALQDQQVGLEKWELAGAKDDTPLPDPQEYVAEEAQAARQCITEGQAQVVWFDYTLAPLGKNILTAPEFVDAVRGAMGASKDSPVFSDAPLFLQESLLMPYTFGLDFVRTVLANRGKDAAFAGLLHDPPVDTRQIMQPETYLLHQVVAPPKVPDLDALVAPDYKRIDFGSMGEFDVYLLAKQYGANDAPNYYRHWRGGYYFAVRGEVDPKVQIGLLYYSRWDSPEAARDFAKLYADYVPKRYDSVSPTTTPATHDAQYVFHAVRSANGGSGGIVMIENQGNDLLIMENFDDMVMEKARQVFFYGWTPAPRGAKEKK